MSSIDQNKSSDFNHLSQLQNKLLQTKKGVTETTNPLNTDSNATEVYMNTTSDLKYSKNYVSSIKNHSLTSAIIDEEAIARLNRLSKYDSSDYSIDSFTLLDVSIGSSSSDTFAKESSNEIIRATKSDNTLKGSLNSNQSRYVIETKTSRDTLKKCVSHNKNDEDNAELNEKEKVSDNPQLISLESTQDKETNDSPMYPKIDKIIIDMPTTSQDDMKYHAFLTNHMITTIDPLTLMLKSKEDELVKNSKSVICVRNDKSFTKISLQNVANSTKKTCVEEVHCFSSLTDIWDKLALYFDVSLKRMEISLTEKILSEMKRSYDKIEKYATKQTQSKLDYIKSNMEMDANKASSNKLHKKTNGYFSELIQCNIQNQIDKPPFKIINGDVKINLEDTFEAKQLKKPAIKQYFDTIKPLGVLKKKKESGCADADGDKEDRGDDNNEPGYRKAIHKSIRFVRTNAIVLSGVPVFFLSLFIIYGVILLIIKVVKIYQDFKNWKQLGELIKENSWHVILPRFSSKAS